MRRRRTIQDERHRNLPREVHPGRHHHDRLHSEQNAGLRYRHAVGIQLQPGDEREVRENRRHLRQTEHQRDLFDLLVGFRYLNNYAERFRGSRRTLRPGLNCNAGPNNNGFNVPATVYLIPGLRQFQATRNLVIVLLRNT